MKVSGSHVLSAPREQVWAALQDPLVLVRTLPGCLELERTGTDAYRITLEAGVAAIKGVYSGSIQLCDQQPPDAYTLKASGQGAPGTVEATARLTLADAEGGGTRVSYDADAVVGGAVGGVGQRMLTGVAKRTTGEFFAAVDADLAGGLAVPSHALQVGSQGSAGGDGEAGPVSGQVFRAPPGEPRVDRSSLLLAALAGAAIALLGVLVGRRR